MGRRRGKRSLPSAETSAGDEKNVRNGTHTASSSFANDTEEMILGANQDWKFVGKGKSKEISNKRANERANGKGSEEHGEDIESTPGKKGFLNESKKGKKKGKEKAIARPVTNGEGSSKSGSTKKKGKGKKETIDSSAQPSEVTAEARKYYSSDHIHLDRKKKYTESLEDVLQRAKQKKAKEKKLPVCWIGLFLTVAIVLIAYALLSNDIILSPGESSLRPGLILKDLGAKPKYPVLLFPGICSSGLELWESHPCAAHLFRQRVWGTVTMAQEMMLNWECWVKHLRLDPKTGLDPPGVKVRGAFGLQAADYLVPGFWIWAKVIESLGDIGYDSNTMAMIGYDWRLSFRNMQERDMIFSKTLAFIQLLRKSMGGEKVVVVSHSMGSNLFYYFMKWVESPYGGDLGPNWVNENIHGFLNVGGPLLGTAKVYASLMSGEMRDTAMLGTFNRFIGKYTVVRILRTFHSLMSLLPIGGNMIWGTSEYAPDDGNMSLLPHLNETESIKREQWCMNKHGSYGKFLILEPERACKEGDLSQCSTLYSRTAGEREVLSRLKGAADLDSLKELEEPLPPVGNLTVEGAMKLLMELGGESFEHIWNTSYDASVRTEFKYPVHLDPQKYWANPLASRLPNAPGMTIYCMYGVSKLTERGYAYRSHKPPIADILRVKEEHDEFLESGERSLRYDIDTENENDPYCGRTNGVIMGDGDGTVPLISLGFMCARGWQDDALPYNPGKVRVRIREYEDQPSTLLESRTLRGGMTSGDHVDIMGNHELLGDMLKIVSGLEEEVDERIISHVREMSARVRIGDHN